MVYGALYNESTLVLVSMFDNSSDKIQLDFLNSYIRPPLPSQMGVLDNVEWSEAYLHTTIPHVLHMNVLYEIGSGIHVPVLDRVLQAIDNCQYMPWPTSHTDDGYDTVDR